MADREPDEEFHLGKAAEHEVMRLITHPLRERRRLNEELEEGQTAGLGFLLGKVALSVWFLAALLMAVCFVVAYLVV